jgi:hypothetical protein
MLAGTNQLVWPGTGVAAVASKGLLSGDPLFVCVLLSLAAQALYGMLQYVVDNGPAFRRSVVSSRSCSSGIGCRSGFPAGLSDGLPVGLQIAGPAFSEARLLDAAYALEQAISFEGVPRP